ncbi:1513_t:CDS:2, partial [Racocetra persica]
KGLEKCITRNTVTTDFHGFIIQGIEKIYLVHLPMFDMENHRYQLILQAEMPKEIMDAYIKERVDNPKQVFILGNQNKTTLNDIISGKEFKAVIDKIDKDFPPSDGQHWKVDVEITCHFISMAQKNECHIDHLLVKSPNIQLSADRVVLDLENGFPDDIKWENGILAYFTDIREGK